MSTSGILPSQTLEAFVKAGYIFAGSPISADQIQPASVDLRLGPVAYRVRASFLSSETATVLEKVEQFKMHEIDLTRPSVLEKGCVYIVPLLEELNLPAHISGRANPKSTTGRLDIFTRLITDRGAEFERVVPGYKGNLYTEVVPRTFSVLVREGTRLNQLRLSRGSPASSDTKLGELHGRETLVYSKDEAPGEAVISKGLRLSVDLQGTGESAVIGYRAKKYAPLVDLSKIDFYDPPDFWEPIYKTGGNSMILDPEDFYILASKEKVRIPPGFAAEMVPYDPAVGEFRIHYAGFFDPGFGYGADDIKGTHAVLEVRTHEVPFLLEDGQIVARLLFEKLTEAPDKIYGAGIGSAYQRQGLALSKQFKAMTIAGPAG